MKYVYIGRIRWEEEGLSLCYIFIYLKSVKSNAKIGDSKTTIL